MLNQLKLTQVNLSQPMAIKRALRRGGGEEETDEDIGHAAMRIYSLLHEGHYEDAAGRRVPVRGDVSKISKIIGLKPTEKAILRIFTSCRVVCLARGRCATAFVI